MSRAVKKRFLQFVFILLAFASLFAQETEFAVISDTHIGAGNAVKELESVVAAINARKGLEFVAVTGDITEKGRPSEFTEAKKILDGLKIPYRVIPGNHDSHWIGYGLANFRNAWLNDRFLFQRGNGVFIGLNTWDSGHLAPEDLAWLDKTLESVPAAAAIFLFVHYPPDSIDNWHAAHNILKDRHVCLICGHGHKTQRLESHGIPGTMARAAIGRGKADAWGYLLVRNAPNAVDFFEATGNAAPAPAGTINKNEWKPAAEMPPKPFQNFGVKILWEKELGTHMAVPPAVHKDRIYAVDGAGNITSFGPNGDIRWTHKTQDMLISRPAIDIDKEELLAASRNGRLLKIDVHNGLTVRVKELGEPVTSQLEVIKKGPQGRLALLVATNTGASSALFCLDAETLERIWVNPKPGGMIQTRPLVVSSRVVYGSWDGHVHCLALKDGRELWSWTENNNFYYSPAGCVPATDGKNIFVCAPDGFVSSIDLETGRTKWREKFASWESLGISADKKRLFIKSRIDEFNVVDAKAGRLIRKISPSHGKGDLMPSEPVEWKGRILFGAQNGYVYQIERSYRIKPLLFLGAAAVHSIQHVQGDIFAASNVDGRIVVFELPR
jgi:outer membrane protein assembly factor BamB/predicted phosphodiesterase